METNERIEEVEVMDAEVIENPEEEEIDEASLERGGPRSFLAGVAVGVGLTKAAGFVWGKVKNTTTKLRKRTVAKILDKEGIDIPKDYLEVPAEEETEKESKEESK